MLGETGVELPKREEMEFVDPEIIPLDVNVSLLEHFAKCVMRSVVKKNIMKNICP